MTAKFRASRRHRFEDTKRIMSPEIHPKTFGTFEKQAPAQLELSQWTCAFLINEISLELRLETISMSMIFAVMLCYLN